LDISTDWTLVLQKEILAQEDLVQSLNITLSGPISPTTTRGTTPTVAEQESQLAKSQLGFIDLFAEPLWRIGAELFFPGMSLGLTQIHDNRQVWMQKITAEAPRPVLDEGTSSVSTLTSGTVKSGETAPTPGSPTSHSEQPRRVLSNDAVKEGRKTHHSPVRPMRKEKSFSSFMFWKKKVGNRQLQQ
jgi:hypothetical protein